jgi:hypothetical protein
MSISVKDITKLNSLQSFKLLAGEKGLNKIVKVAGILDHEFLDNDKPFKVDAFDQDSFVISSLLFAKENKNLILPAMEGLMKAGVSGFAFKTVIHDELPIEVLEFANKNAFPVYSFNKGIEFENVIFEIMDAVKKDDNLYILEKNIGDMIEKNLTRSEVTILTKGIATSFKNQAKIACLSNIQSDNVSIVDSVLRKFNANEILAKKAIICRFRDNLIVIITMIEMNQNKFKVILKEIIDYCDLKEKVAIGYSNTHSAYEGMDYCLREGYYASIVGKIEGKREVEYKKIGTYQVLIPTKNSDEATSFMFRYLEPVFNQEDQLKTAIQYVLVQGDVNKTAERLICHKNTVRYRINKLKELLDQEATDFVFYENLSTAIRIYLLKQLTF